ncbi:hypothetical protein [Enterobacter asburiae]|uniref:hypothetical protein n=1 Tax=Enterobacter asburiae TaxID=61645 RepID=UPI0018ED0B95|nr:hypothetical protein [Enterobacter asburiae]MBJ6588699.1 hypothetical protein [Enterobacter asburiae]HAS1942849.1 hypothetical protein [Enterobacter asburiae]
MKYQIETQDHYLRVALENILLIPANEEKICIIDLASFLTLGEIRACIKVHKDYYRYLLIGDEGVYSRILSSQVSMNRKMSLMEYRKIIQHYPSINYETLSRSIDQHLNMEGFTHKENSTIYSLLIHDSFISAAKHIGINPKSFYQRVDILGKKLNLSNRLQTQLYLRREFLPDSVRHRINEQIRQAFRVA